MSRPAAGGGRWVEVDPERIGRWLEDFDRRHGGTEIAVGDRYVDLRAPDGAQARVEVPFPPLPPGASEADRWGGVARHAQQDRRVGVLLLRRGGHAAGVLHGPELVSSKVGSRHVQGRTAAGGWSQQRFARRRAGQTREAVAAAAEAAARVLLPEQRRLDAVVTGGDRALLRDVLSDPRLLPLRPLVSARVLDVPDPRLSVLTGAARAVRAVRIHLLDVPPGDAG